MMAGIDAMISWVKSEEPADQDLPVLIAGEPERIARAERLADDMEIDHSTWAQLPEIAERHQIRIDS